MNTCDTETKPSWILFSSFSDWLTTVIVKKSRGRVFFYPYSESWYVNAHLDLFVLGEKDMASRKSDLEKIINYNSNDKFWEKQKMVAVSLKVNAE